MARPKERFCKRGHDTHEVGRVRKGWCKACAYLADTQGGIQGKHKPTYSPEWTRARVKRWLEIVKEDPMERKGGTRLRVREFEERYERLEAAVPTPTTPETVDV